MTHPKIAFIGAGSTVFAKTLLGDILSYPELSGATLALYDIDAERLATSERVAHHVAAALAATPQIVATTDRERALDGADYAISMFQVGGYRPATVTDFEVPKRYGLRQTIGDTLGIGGIMRALRTIPVFLDLCRDLERLAPDVLHLNYVNPMAMNCLAMTRASSIKTVGLCHSVQGTAEQLARDLGVPPDEITYLCAGINHVAYYLKLEHQGQDLYPRLRRLAEEGRVPDWNRVRYEVFRHFGYFGTESSEHFAEYVPWFIKEGREDLLARFNIPLDEYLRRCEVQLAGWRFLKEKLERPEADVPAGFEAAMRAAGATEAEVRSMGRELRTLHEVRRSHEYGSSIIFARETGQPTVVYGNVPNDGLIENLPYDCCVEVPCLVDANGVQPTKIGRIPPQLAALMQTNIGVQQLTVEAALSETREHVYHAAMLDPHTAAELDLEQIRALVDDLISAHGDWLPAYLHGGRPAG
jgi:alpha-galactosidase